MKKNDTRPNKREYSSWTAMRQRCINPKTKEYERYGGRGIGTCARWQDFDRFLEDMGARPEGTTLDRIDNNGNYCKENCRWATWLEQQNNRRNNRSFEFLGVKRTMAEWARLARVRTDTLGSRIKRGWPPEKALFPLARLTAFRYSKHVIKSHRRTAAELKAVS